MNTLSNRGFGIEIECFGVSHEKIAQALTRSGIPCNVESYNHSTRTAWKMTSDASLVGRYSGELVSPILRGADGLQQVRTVCAVLNALGVKVNKSTGLHVHHSTNDLELKNWKMLFLQYVKHEAVIDSYLPTSRRAMQNRFCKSLRQSIGGEISDVFTKISGANTTDDLLNIVNSRWNGGRYHTVNMTNYALRGTVEFRQHSGTTSADKIISWVVFTRAMVEYSFVLRWYNTQGTDNADNLFAFRRFFTGEKAEAVKDLRKYFTARAEALASAEAA